MDATFEIIVAGQEPEYAGQAARAAFDEVDALERELSRFIQTSDVAQVNALSAGGSVCVGIDAFECLALAQSVWVDTAGAFDVTVGSGLNRVQAIGGMDLLKLNAQERTVGVEAEGLKVDLGGIGKGYAVDRIAALLRDWSIEGALVHSGQSTVLAMGKGAGEQGWTVGLRDPEHEQQVIAAVLLRDEALSGSAAGLDDPHIVDPRTGRPPRDKLASWAKARSAALADALSTAFMVMTESEIEAYCDRDRRVAAMVLPARAAPARFGPWD